MTLNDYIVAHAGEINDITFLAEFLDAEIFAPILRSSQPVAPGTVPEDVQLTYKVAKLPAGRMLVFYASKADQRLGKPFVGMPLREALKKATLLDGIQGLLIHNDRNDWFAANRSAIMDFLANHGDTRELSV